MRTSSSRRGIPAHRFRRKRGTAMVDLTVKGGAQDPPRPCRLRSQDDRCLHTNQEPARDFVDRMKALQGKDGVLSVPRCTASWPATCRRWTCMPVITDDDIKWRKGRPRSWARSLRDGWAFAAGLPAVRDRSAAASGLAVMADDWDSRRGSRVMERSSFARLIERNIGKLRTGRSGSNGGAASNGRG